MQTGKLNPYNDAKISFPGFQRILDFTATGSESTKSVTVDGDTDKEYIILVRNLASSGSVNLLIGNDSTTYGFQSLINNAGTISAARDTSESAITLCSALAASEATMLCATGFLKTIKIKQALYTSGTTIGYTAEYGYSYDGTSNFSTLDFANSSGNFTAGTRIIVYARRSQ